MIYSSDMSGLAWGFVHKRLGRAVKGFVTSGFSPSGAAAGFISPAPRGRAPTRTTPRRPLSRSLTARPSASGAAEKQAGRSLKFSAGVPTVAGACIWPARTDPITGECKLFIGDKPGIDDPERRFEVGDAVMGRYGAAYHPGSQIVDRAICLAGDVVGDDGLCYPKSSLTNRQRAWPRGRRPLLTGGEMKAISVAARAGKRLEMAQKRLQKIGLMKKPAPRRAKQITSGPTSHHHHEG